MEIRKLCGADDRMELSGVQRIYQEPSLREKRRQQSAYQ